jgi:hypothetical protein
MVRTQVQLPDELYRRAKNLAAAHEITLAEVVRRGLEHMLRIYPSARAEAEVWRPPMARPLGRFKAPAEQWRELGNER